MAVFPEPMMVNVEAAELLIAAVAPLNVMPPLLLLIRIWLVARVSEVAAPNSMALVPEMVAVPPMLIGFWTLFPLAVEPVSALAAESVPPFRYTT